MLPELHSRFSAEAPSDRERRRARALRRGLLGSALGAAAAFWVAIGAPGLDAFRTAPDPFAGARPQARESWIYYPNCSAARAEGADPLHAGQPGYRRTLDEDGDGVACESDER